MTLDTSGQDHPTREAPAPDQNGRAGILGAVKTPLGFYSLVILAVEGILGSTVAFTTGRDRTFLVLGMLILVVSLVALVTVMATWRPQVLYGIISDLHDAENGPEEQTPDSEVTLDITLLGHNEGVRPSPMSSRAQLALFVLPLAAVAIGFAALRAEEVVFGDWDAPSPMWSLYIPFAVSILGLSAAVSLGVSYYGGRDFISGNMHRLKWALISEKGDGIAVKVLTVAVALGLSGWSAFISVQHSYFRPDECLIGEWRVTGGQYAYASEEGLARVRYTPASSYAIAVFYRDGTATVLGTDGLPDYKTSVISGSIKIEDVPPFPFFGDYRYYTRGGMLSLEDGSYDNGDENFSIGTSFIYNCTSRNLSLNSDMSIVLQRL
jgi:hypothetical protein